MTTFSNTRSETATLVDVLDYLQSELSSAGDAPAQNDFMLGLACGLESAREHFLSWYRANPARYLGECKHSDSMANGAPDSPREEDGTELESHLSTPWSRHAHLMMGNRKPTTTLVKKHEALREVIDLVQFTLDECEDEAADCEYASGYQAALVELQDFLLFIEQCDIENETGVQATSSTTTVIGPLPTATILQFPQLLKVVRT